MSPLSELSPPSVQADLKDGSHKTASRLREKVVCVWTGGSWRSDKVTKRRSVQHFRELVTTASLTKWFVPQAPSDQEQEPGNKASLNRCYTCTYLCDIYHVSNKSKPFQFQLRDVSLEQHVDLCNTC